MRDAVGPDVEVLIDAHGRFSPGTAIAHRAGDRAQPTSTGSRSRCDPENVGALHKIGRSIRTRLATGERCYTRYHLQALLATNEVGVLQPDLMHVGGMLEAKKIAAIADAAYMPVSFHNPFGPVATAAAIQLDACTTNFIMQEIVLRVHAALALRSARASAAARGRAIRDLRRGRASASASSGPRRRKAHPFDPDAFLPMWKEGDWRSSF